MKRSLQVLFLVVVVAVLAGCSHQEKPNSDAETDYSTIFQQATDSDGATAESIADELAKQNNQTTTSNFPCNFNFTVSNMNRFN